MVPGACLRNIWRYFVAHAVITLMQRQRPHLHAYHMMNPAMTHQQTTDTLTPAMTPPTSMTLTTPMDPMPSMPPLPSLPCTGGPGDAPADPHVPVPVHAPVPIHAPQALEGGNKRPRLTSIPHQPAGDGGDGGYQQLLAQSEDALTNLRNHIAEAQTGQVAAADRQPPLLIPGPTTAPTEGEGGEAPWLFLSQLPPAALALEPQLAPPQFTFTFPPPSAPPPPQAHAWQAPLAPLASQPDEVMAVLQDVAAGVRALQAQAEDVREVRRAHAAVLAAKDREVAAKDREIASLRAQVDHYRTLALRAVTGVPSSGGGGGSGGGDGRGV